MNKKINSFLKNVSNKTVFVIGDIMLDSYFFGDSSRKSPEAPVKIIDVKEKKYKIGGAGNVAHNLKKIGVNTFLFGFIGNDQNGKEIISILKTHKISTSGIVKTTNKTTNKTRILNNSNKQLLRIDEENINYTQLKEKEKLLRRITNKINLADLIIIQDYNKGLMCESFIKKILILGQKNNIPIMVDPKEYNFLKYQNIKLLKPNLLEAEKILKQKIKINNLSLKNSLQKLSKKIKSDFIMLTLGKNGLCIYGKNTFHREKGIKEK